MKEKYVNIVVKKLQGEKEKVTKEDVERKMQFVKKDEEGTLYFFQGKKSYYIWVYRNNEVYIQPR